PGKAHSIDRTRREVLDHHVAFLDQLREDCGACRRLRIERYAAFVGIQHREIKAVGSRNVSQLTAGGISLARLFNLDDVGAEPRQNLGAGRSRLDMCHVQNPYTLQSFSHDYPSSAYLL